MDLSELNTQLDEIDEALNQIEAELGASGSGATDGEPRDWHLNTMTSGVRLGSDTMALSSLSGLPGRLCKKPTESFPRLATRAGCRTVSAAWSIGPRNSGIPAL